ncbi:DEAD-box ATP-dependent RNA helicase 7-like [Phoenix dactylifera]|uniref:DEAD-box ATP-dependent RNA helicase 7 n=1 Tax=Phoenix dactylifera TaxID=42345 RepID=A0A8B7D3X3_PHODC|nr:DEAD-box ATP-dependent RNA helicase 7-like [Phoenix dactylifera]
MPSLLFSSPSELEDLKKSKKKSKKAESMAAELEQNGFIEAEKKSKKKKHKKLESDDEEIDNSDGEGSEKKKSKKKRKASDEETSETSSDGSDPILDRKVAAVNGSALKKPKLMQEDEDGEVIASREESGAANPNPNAVSKFRISKVLREKLKSKGIESLFPIQAMTFNLILDGSDLVGRARTGQGKTLAFVLPILESLTNGQHKASRKTGYGRPPSVLVLLPTRELANQVSADFEVYGGAVGLSSCCLYGGSPYRGQELALKRGVDIVVGTPGRIKDHLERGTLDLKFLKFRVLDEADEMLNMGFVDDVELILGKVEDVSKVQTLLFSATLPDWVKKISARFLKPNKKTADLVGNEKLKASASVRHLVLPCTRQARAQLIPDIIRCYSRGGRTIIFTETKESASQLAGLLPGSRALHGDIVQSQREVILAGFRSGRFLGLVATNVAARGLDIHDVQLIIQCEPPRDVEAYIHRSGRTGRAGNTGVSILLYEPRYSYSISRLERESGVKFEHISAPQPADVAESAGSEAADSISNVSDSVVPVFRSQAEELLSSSGLSAVDLLAKALAKAAGYTDIKKRSLLSSMENYVTLLLEAGKTIYSPSVAFSILKRFMPDEKIEGVKGLSLTADGMGAVFDVPADDVDAFIEGQENANMVTIEVLKSLPSLQDKDQSRGGNTGRGRFGGGRSSGGRGGRGGFGRRDGGGRGKGNGGGRNRFNRR